MSFANIKPPNNPSDIIEMLTYQRDVLHRALELVEDHIEIGMATADPEPMAHAEELIHDALVLTGLRSREDE